MDFLRYRLNIISGLDRPTTGSVKFKGLELFDAGDRALTACRKRTPRTDRSADDRERSTGP